MTSQRAGSLLACFLACLALAACPNGGGGGGDDNGGGGGDGSGFAPEITISNFAFSPANLVVAPGTTILVRNLDPVEHSVTSQAAQDTYTFGGVNGVTFDTGLFTGATAFSVPSSAPVGTIVPYFCRSHTSMMANRGQLTIQAAAASQ